MDRLRDVRDILFGAVGVAFILLAVYAVSKDTWTRFGDCTSRHNVVYCLIRVM